MVDEQSVSINLTVDKSNLYREKTFSDLKVCTIRQLNPVSR